MIPTVYARGYRENRKALDSDRLRIGQRICHPVFGNGTVKARAMHSVTFDFDLHGDRELLASFIRGRLRRVIRSKA